MTTDPRRAIMRAIFRQGLAAAKRDGDARRMAQYQECLDRMKGKRT